MERIEKPWKRKLKRERERGPLWNLMRSFLRGWGGVAFLRERLAAITERALDLRSSSNGMEREEGSKTASSWCCCWEWDLNFFIEVEVAPLERLVGRDMKWNQTQFSDSSQHTILFLCFSLSLSIQFALRIQYKKYKIKKSPDRAFRWCRRMAHTHN